MALAFVLKRTSSLVATLSATLLLNYAMCLFGRIGCNLVDSIGVC